MLYIPYSLECSLLRSGFRPPEVRAGTACRDLEVRCTEMLRFGAGGVGSTQF